MVEELEMLDFDDLLQEKSLKQVSRLFQQKLNQKFKITVVLKRAFNIQNIQTKKNELFSKNHIHLTDETNSNQHFAKRLSRSEINIQENRENNTKLSSSFASQDYNNMPILPQQIQSGLISPEPAQQEQLLQEDQSTSNDENTSVQECSPEQHLHPLTIKINLAIKNFKDGYYSKAQEMLQSIFQEAFGLLAKEKSNQVSKFYILICVQCLCNQSQVCISSGQYEEATKQNFYIIITNWCLERCLRQFEINDLDVIAKIYVELGTTSMKELKFLRALEFQKKALIIYETLNWKLQIANVLVNMSQTLAYLCKLETNIFEESYEDAKKLSFEALRLFKLKLSDDIQIYEVFHTLGFIFYQMKEYELALEYLDQSMEGKEKLYGETHISMAKTLNLMGIVSQIMNLTDNAIDYYQKAIIIYGYQKYNNIIRGVAQIGMAQILNNLALAYIEKMKIQSARLAFEKANQIFTDYFPENHPIVRKTQKNKQLLMK